MDGEVTRLLATLAQGEMDTQHRAYLRLHRRRYGVLLAGVRERVNRLPADRRQAPRLLDVGPGPQTELMRAAIPAAHVDSIGFASPQTPPREAERHIPFDLNLALDPERHPDVGEAYDLAVIAEVIEHLTTSPVAALSCVASWLRPGGWVVLQTPNLLALHKRLRMLVGKNPLGSAGRIGTESNNPWHFREYTLDELAEIARATGHLDVEEAVVQNYFTRLSAAGRAYDRVTALLPASMRQGITLYLRAA